MTPHTLTVLPWPHKSSEGQAHAHTFMPPTLSTPQLAVTPAPFPTGLFEPGDTKYEAHRDLTQDPSLMEMTEAALRLLSRNPRGYYLFVEGEWQPLAEQRWEVRAAGHHLPLTWPSCRRPH